MLMASILTSLQVSPQALPPALFSLLNSRASSSISPGHSPCVLVVLQSQQAKVELSIHPTQTQYLLSAYSEPGSVLGPGEVLRCRLGLRRSHQKLQPLRLKAVWQ